jgi:RNA polymerase sigma-B factor
MPSPISQAQPEELLLRNYARNPSPALEEELVNRFMPLARSLAMRYRGRAEQTEDLLQVASLALVKALRGYDPERGRRFAAYAAPTILGELRRHFRDHAWRMHLPRSVQENALLVERVSGLLGDELGSSPTVSQIAERADLTEEEVLDAMNARETQRAVSLDGPVGVDDGSRSTLGEEVGNHEPGFEAVEAQLAAEKCARLDEREQRVLSLRFHDDLNQYEIGNKLGISQMQVSRVMRKALAKLLEAVQGDELPDGTRTLDEQRRRRRRRGVQAKEAEVAA